jgi:hypothetical protein
MEMAQETGFTASSNPDLYDIMLVCDKSLEAFAALVREDEREACAKVCEDSVEYAGDELARQIRARGQA